MRKLIFAIALLFVLPQLKAQITYDAGSNTITIEGFPPDMPCSLNNLYMTDKVNGWGKITRKENVYKVNANIVLGHPGSSDSCLQIAGNQSETLLLNGNLTVSPFFVRGVNKKLFWETQKAENLLIIGDRKRPEISGKLIISKGNNLFIGTIRKYKRKLQVGGGLIAFNCKITAPENTRFGGKFVWIHSGAKIILKNSDISRFNGNIYGFYGKNKVVENSVFEDGGGIIAGKCLFLNCTFKNLNNAIVDYGKLDATFDSCVFEGNTRNWRMQYYFGITCIDCKIGNTKLPDIYNTFIRKGETVFPRFISRRHVVVKVVDISGTPVEGVVVTAVSELPGNKLVSNSGVKTGSDGLTPGKESLKALLLTEKIIIATKDKNHPDQKDYSYKIIAEKNGRKVVFNNFKPTKSWQILTLKLK